MEYEINIDSFIQYYSSDVTTSRNIGSADDLVKHIAINNARSDALSGLSNPSYPTPSNSSSSSSSKMFGLGLSISGVTYDNETCVQREFDIVEGTGGKRWYASSRANKSYTGYAYQLKLKFTLPTGITSNNIKSAHLVSGCSITGNNYTYAVYAATGETEQTGYIRPRGATIFEKMTSFTPSKSTTSLNIDITTTLKRCLDKGQGWITLGRDASDIGSGPRIYLNGTTKIIYTLNYTNCIAPDSVTFTQDNIITSASTSGIVSRAIGAANVVVVWAAGEAGEENPITGYTMYYNSGAPPTKETTTKVTTASNVLTASIDISSFTRGVTYYVKIVTNGTIEGFDSDISEAGCSFTINSLPNAPVVSTNKNRILSTSTSSNKDTIQFTLITGEDNDNSQTKTIRYATSEVTPTQGNTTAIISGEQKQLYEETTYYFWTYDGLEFSETFTSKIITKNHAPTIGSVTMTAYNNTTYLPVTRDGYVKNINTSVSGIDKDSAATLTYQWYLEIGDGAAATTYSPISLNISGYTSSTTIQGLNNIDVTSYGVTFDKAYRVKLVITDDIGETAQESSTQVFAIPAAPTINYIYNQKNNSYATYSNRFHFEDGLRFVYSGQNTGITRELYYSTSYNDTYTLMNLGEPTSSGGSYFNDITLSSFTRSSYYYFKIKYILSSSVNMYATIIAVTDESTPQNCWYSNDQNTTKGFMRALDITPNNIVITSAVKPYTDSTFTFNFGNQPIQWNATQDVSTEYSDIYTINIKGNNNSITLTTTGNNSSGTVASTMNNFSSSISTADWKTITTGTTRAPNKSYTLTLEIIATNGFGHAFPATKTFTANFVEGVNSFGANGPELRIQTGTNEYTKIPSSYNGKSNISRYPIFEGQTLQVAVNGLTTYADQAATIYFMLGDTSLGSTSITSSQWTAPSEYNHLYTLNVEKTILYTVPKNTVATYSSDIRDFYVKVVLLEDNNTTTRSTDTGQNNGNLNTCIHYRFDLDSIRFNLNNIVENSGSFTAGWSCTDFGGMTSNTKYTKSYSSIVLELRYDSTSGGNYANIAGSPTSLPNVGTTTMSTTGQIGGTASITNDIVYFGVYATYVLNFRTIDVNGTTKTPTGQTTYTGLYKNLITLYRSTPNLLYGTNFFVLNASSPLSNTTDQVLELHPGTGGRNKIYFHNTNHYIMIDDNNNEVIFEGMTVDGGTWDT